MTVRRLEWTATEAKEALQVFLDGQRDAFPALTVGLVLLDYSAASVVEAVRRIASEITAGRIGEAEAHPWYAGLGYYLGESLRRARRGLTWDIGNLKLDHENLPVISGFADGLEADVIAICHNIIYAVVTRELPVERIDDTIEHWFDAPTSREV